MSTVRFFEKDHFNVAILAVAAAMTMLVFFVNRNLSDLASSNSFAVERPNVAAIGGDILTSTTPTK